MYNFKRQGYKLLFVYHLLWPLLSLGHLYQLRFCFICYKNIVGSCSCLDRCPTKHMLSGTFSKGHKDYGMDLRQDRTRIMTPGRDLDPSVRIQGHPLLVCSQLSLEDYSCPSKNSCPSQGSRGKTRNLHYKY